MRLANRLSLYALIICAIMFVVTAVFVEAWTLGAEAMQAKWIVAREQNEITENIDSVDRAQYVSMRMPYKNHHHTDRRARANNRHLPYSAGRFS